jgi:hypothetical protein
MNTQPDYAAAWRDFRTRRIIFCAVFLSYMPGVFAIYFAVGLPLSALTGIKPDYFGLAIASCWMAAFAVTGWRVAGFSCPGVTSMHCGKSTNRVDRDARHEACSTRSRATSSTKPPPIATPREPARPQSAGRPRRPCGQAIAGVARFTLPGTRQRLPCAAKWNTCGRGTPYGVTYTHFAIVSRSAATS